MSANKNNEFDKYIIDAKYVTIWDDGDTIIESECRLNLITHSIIEIGKREIIKSPYNENIIDDFIDILEEEFIVLSDGSKIYVTDKNDTIHLSDYNIIPFVIE